MRPKNAARNTACIKCGLTMQFHADVKKRRSFLTMLFVSGELRR